MKQNKIIAGIDEVGRGPLAGPLAIGLAVCFWNARAKKLLAKIKDSKKLSLIQREKWLKKIKESGLIEMKISYISSQVIDKRGMAWALKKGVERVLKKSVLKADLVYLDGGLKAPAKYKQKTIIKGDEKIKIISAASVFAKVSRDKLMVEKSKKYAGYFFEKNAGYGTPEHIKAIKKRGACPIHRKSFLRKIV